MSQPLRLVVILNGVSRKKKKFYRQILPALQASFDVVVRETESREHAITLGKEAAHEKPFGVLAAGGDGTLNQVLNGLMQSGEQVLPALGIIPLGTGNDFARMMGVQPTAQSIVQTLQAKPQPIDIGQIDCCTAEGKTITRYFLNVVSLGMGPAVVHELFTSNRALGATLTYLKAILKVFFTHTGNTISVASGEQQWQGNARVFAVANGQSFGGGIFIAPDAKPNDGLFQTFLASDLPLLKFLWVLQVLKGKRKVRHANIQYDTTQSITITSPEPCWLEAEGELMGMLPGTVSIMKEKIKFFV
jgi:diacylglycerol kinase (ATP)